MGLWLLDIQRGGEGRERDPTFLGVTEEALVGVWAGAVKPVRPHRFAADPTIQTRIGPAGVICGGEKL